MTEEKTAAEKAIKVVKERMTTYGHPAEVYRPVSRLWSGYLGIRVSPKDVALLMVLFKMGREMTKQGEDNLVDMHGYLDVYERLMERIKQDASITVAEGT